MAWIDQSGVDLSGFDLSGADFGRVMLTRFTVVTDRSGAGIGLIGEGSNVVRLTGAGTDRLATGSLVSANDNVVWVGDEDGSGTGGVIGRDAQALALINGDTIVTWVGVDGSINGKAYADSAPDRSGDLTDDFSDSPAISASSVLTGLLTSIATITPDQRYRIVETGRDSFAILWAATLAGVIVLHGRQFSLSADGDGEWTARTLASAPLGSGAAVASFDVLGWSAEADSATVSYRIAGQSADVVKTIKLEFDADADTEGPSVEAARTAGPASRGGAIDGDETSPVGLAKAEGANSLGTDTASDTAFFSIHAGVVDVEGTGGLVLIGDTYGDVDSVAGYSDGDVVSFSSDTQVGTVGDDILIGDLPDLHTSPTSALAGADDTLSGGGGNNVFYGGGGDDKLDGRSPSGGVDTAIVTGDSRAYSITPNGDGTYTVVLASSDNGAEINRSAGGFEGVDIADDVEQYQFLNGDTAYVAGLVNGADIATLDTSGHGVVLESDLYQIPSDALEAQSSSHDGTLTSWGLTRDESGNVDNVIDVASVVESGGHEAPASGAPVVAAISDGGFAVGYVADGDLHIETFDALGRQDGSATSSVGIDPTISPVIDTSGDGLAVAYVSAGPDAAIGVAIVDPHGGSGLHAAASIAVTADVSDLAIAGTCDGDIVNVAWVESIDEATGTGDIVVQRLDTSDDGQPALTEAGLDGEAGEGSDSAETIGVGRAPAITETSDDGFAIAWIGEGGPADQPAEQIQGSVFSSDGLVVETFSLPVGEGKHVREGTGPTIETTGDGDLFVSWQEVDEVAGGLAIMSALLKQLGSSEWSDPIIRELKKFDDEPSEVSIAVAGDNGDAIIVTWVNDGDGGGEIVGQRFSVEAIAEGAGEFAVGLEFEVAASTDEGKGHDKVNVTGLDDGRVIVVSREIQSGNDGTAPAITVQAAVLDTRDPDELLIADDAGAGQDTNVGTIGDDIVDGRGSSDELYGVLGNDILTGGTGDDHLDGGDGDDTLIAGSGTDHLDGGEGDDLLMGGFGRDYVHGGDGIDTLSYRGETRSVIVDLAEGIVRSDAAYNAVALPPQGLDVRGISTGTFFDANVEDILGRMEATNRGSEGGVEFYVGHGIENIEGGLGADVLLGDGSDNVLTGGKGNDSLDGRDGHDTATFIGNAADYDLAVLADGSVSVRHARNTSAATNDGTDTLRNVEAVSFADGMFELASDGSLSPASIAAAFGIVSEISVTAVECFDFTALDAVSSELGNSGTGSYGSVGNSGSTAGTSGSSSLPVFSAAELCGLGSDTLYFGDLDALCPSNPIGMDLDDLFGSDGLDYGACTVLASSAEIEAAMCLDGPDSLDAMTTIDNYLAKPDYCDPTEFRLG